MNCTICRNEVSSVLGIYNDCVIESLEKIKTHYMFLKKQLSDKEIYISKLVEQNENLNESIECYEKKSRKIPRTDSAPSQTDLERSDVFENGNQNISKDDFNRAVNDENDFEVSFTQNSPCTSRKIMPSVKREPMKPLPICVKRSPNNSSPQFRRVTVKDEHDSYQNKPKDTNAWFSKDCGNKETIKNPLRNCSKSTRHSKKNIRPRLALKTGLRQARLQLEVCKNTSNEDSTFCEDVIEASPQQDSSLKKTNSSRQWILRNYSKKEDQNTDDDSTFNVSRASTGKSSTLHPQKHIDEKLDTSSVVMLTPATQDVIFLDDSSESFNVESMDLLKGLINPTEGNLCNLRRIESNRIKMLQKTVSEKIENQTKNHLQCDIEGTNQSNMDLRDIKPKENHTKENDKKSLSNDIKNEDCEKGKRQRLFNVDCNECQAYIKYLGDRLSDREIEDHIRNCTKHKKRVEINPTPDGFWDPFIQPLDKNDPRNETLIDTRFITKERQN